MGGGRSGGLLGGAFCALLVLVEVWRDVTVQGGLAGAACSCQVRLRSEQPGAEGPSGLGCRLQQSQLLLAGVGVSTGTWQLCPPLGHAECNAHCLEAHADASFADLMYRMWSNRPHSACHCTDKAIAVLMTARLWQPAA